MLPGPRSSITLKMGLAVSLGTAGVLAIVLAYSYSYSRKMILEDAEKYARNLSLSEARKIEQEFRAVAKIPQNVAPFLEMGHYDRDTLVALIRRTVSDNREIFGSAVAFAPGAFDKDLKSFASYWYKTEDGLAYQDLATASRSYVTEDWYHLPEVLKAPVWSDPYFDEGGGRIIMTTYSIPFFERGKDGVAEKLKGIITADISLAWLTDLVCTTQLGKSGYCFIISDTGTVVAHPDRTLIMNESIFSLAEERRAAELRRIGLSMLREESGFVDIGSSLTARPAYLAYARIPSPGWSLGAVFLMDELFAELTDLHRRTLHFAIAGIALLLLVSFLIARSITGPLRHIAQATRKVAEGDLDIDLSGIQKKDEVGQLAGAFQRMARELKQYIQDLTETTAAKERIESELSIAAEIQRSMLPSVFPAFPGRNDFDIYAVMRPAKEVGGDFYDFFLLDDEHLCIAIGDVSGKGVPASLFMSVTKYLIEASASDGELPDAVLRRVNNQLGRNNASCMFATVFLGILNLQNGELVYSNGGHNPPLLLKPDNAAAFLTPPGGPVLGLMDNQDFRMDRLVMDPGTVLLAYTDGVTEACDSDDHIFSAERLQETAMGLRAKSVKQIADGLMEEIVSFCDGPTQTDDITMLVLRFRP